MKNRTERGYVALEFALAMGMLVLPTALILLQVPTLLEQHNRIEAISISVANTCAAEVSKIADAPELVQNHVRQEMAATSSLRKSTLRSARCEFDSNVLAPGSSVTAVVSVDVPAAIIPGLPQEPTWTMTTRHSVVIPKYRSFDQ